MTDVTDVDDARPVGRKELALVRASGFRAFPPRLPGQPFFYPVLNQEYATQIARGNAGSSPLKTCRHICTASNAAPWREIFRPVCT